MILVVSNNQALSTTLEKKITSLGEVSLKIKPGFSFVNEFLELELDDIQAIIFDGESMDRTISLLEKNGKIDLIKSLDILKVVNTISDDYIYSTINAIEIEEDSLDEQFDIIIRNFME